MLISSAQQNDPVMCICVHTQSCLTLCHPLDCSPPGSSVHGILQARTLQRVVVLSSRGSSGPRVWTHLPWVPAMADRFFTTLVPPRKPNIYTHTMHCVACRILVPWPGIEPSLPTVEAWSPNQWNHQESRYPFFKNILFHYGLSLDIEYSSLIGQNSF